MVMEFIRSLGRSRVTGVQSKIKGKQYSTVARAKGKSASKFNAAVDAPMQAVKKKSKRRDKDGGDQTASEKKGGKMGLFGRKKKQPPAPSSNSKHQPALLPEFFPKPGNRWIFPGSSSVGGSSPSARIASRNRN